MDTSLPTGEANMLGGSTGQKATLGYFPMLLGNWQ